MKPSLVLNLAKLRTIVAFLGEKKQHNWWSSLFLSESGKAFLDPVFPKTSLLARISGASAAAQLVHDEYIGVGDIFHLFRLPESFEHELSQLFATDNSIANFITSMEEATGQLETLILDSPNKGVGPLLLQRNRIDEELYDATRKLWVVGSRKENAQYAVATYGD